MRAQTSIVVVAFAVLALTGAATAWLAPSHDTAPPSVTPPAAPAATAAGATVAVATDRHATAADESPAQPAALAPEVAAPRVRRLNLVDDHGIAVGTALVSLRRADPGDGAADHGPSRLPQRWTDARGTADFLDLPAGSWRVVLERPAGACRDGLVTWDDRAFSEHNVVVTLADADSRVRGTVLDRDGAPIAGAAVWSRAADGTPGDRMQTPTAGTFVLNRGSDSGADEVELVFDAPDCEPRRVASRWGSELGAIVLRPTRRLLLRLLEAGGQRPVPRFGLEWIAYDATTNRELRRAALPIARRDRGELVLDDVPAGRIALCALLPAHVGASTDGDERARTEIRHPQQATFDWQLPARRVLTVRVVDRQDRPVPACAITLFDADGDTRLGPPTNTGADGCSRLALRAAESSFLVQADYAAHRDTARIDGDGELVELRLPLGGSRLEGTVGPAPTLAALLAVPGARCRLALTSASAPEGLGDGTVVEVAADGRYRAERVPDGDVRCRFVFAAAELPAVTLDLGNLSVPAGEPVTRDFDISAVRVAAVQGAIELQVDDRAEAAAIRLRLRPVDLGGLRLTRDLVTAIADGRFACHVPIGRYLAGIERSGLPRTAWLPEPFVVAADDRNRMLHHVSGTIRAELVDRDGDVVADRVVVIELSGHPVRTVHTDAAGRIEADGLAVGRHELSTLYWITPPRPGDRLQIGNHRVGRRAIGTVFARPPHAVGVRDRLVLIR